MDSYAEIHLNLVNLGDIIIGDNEISSQKKLNTMNFLHNHLHEKLKIK